MNQSAWRYATAPLGVGTSITNCRRPQGVALISFYA